jgi:hypothetical protein
LLGGLAGALVLASTRRCCSPAYSGEGDRPFRPMVITHSGDRDRA